MRVGIDDYADLQNLPYVEFRSLDTFIMTIADKYVSPAHVLAGLGKIVPAMTNLEHLCVLQIGPSRCDQSIKTSPEHQFLNSATLKDFEYSYIDDDNDFACCEGKKTSYHWKPDAKGLPISQCEKLERLAIQSHISLFEVQKYNSLQHLALCLHPGLFPPQTDAKKLL